jgi:hypothetical protein
LLSKRPNKNTRETPIQTNSFWKTRSKLSTKNYPIWEVQRP